MEYHYWDASSLIGSIERVYDNTGCQEITLRYGSDKATTYTRHVTQDPRWVAQSGIMFDSWEVNSQNEKDALSTIAGHKHNTRVVVMDEDGNVRCTYEFTDREVT